MNKQVKGRELHSRALRDGGHRRDVLVLRSAQQAQEIQKQ